MLRSTSAVGAAEGSQWRRALVPPLDFTQTRRRAPKRGDRPTPEMHGSNPSGNERREAIGNVATATAYLRQHVRRTLHFNPNFQLITHFHDGVDFSLMSSRFSIRLDRKIILLAALLIAIPFACSQNLIAQPRTTRSKPGTIVVRTEPNAIVWIDDVRRGVTDSKGTLVINKVASGRRTLRVRAIGFKESRVVLSPSRRGTIDVHLVRTTDKAELLFQQAEAARDKVRDDVSQKAAVEFYRNAIKLRPRFAEAHLGLARALLELNDYAAALEEIQTAQSLRRNFAEASAVEGRILRMAADEAAAIEAFQRAIVEGRGFQPEAHTGLALVYQDQGQYEDSAAEYKKAIAQLSDTEPILYQLLGAVYEKLEKYKEAVAAYEKYLDLAPDGSLAPAIRSVMDQLRTQAEGGGGLPY